MFLTWFSCVACGARALAKLRHNGQGGDVSPRCGQGATRKGDICGKRVAKMEPKSLQNLHYKEGATSTAKLRQSDMDGERALQGAADVWQRSDMCSNIRRACLFRSDINLQEAAFVVEVLQGSDLHIADVQKQGSVLSTGNLLDGSLGVLPQGPRGMMHFRRS